MQKATTLVSALIAAAATLAGTAHAAGENRVPIMAKPPTIDGKIDAAEWAASAGFDGLFNGAKIDQRRVQTYVGADEKNIYIAMRSMLPTKGKLFADPQNDNLNTVCDDSAEVYINPAPNQADQVQYQFLFNSTGKGGYKIHTVAKGNDTPSWKGNWKLANSVGGGWWQWECAIPIETMKYSGPGRKTTDGIWQINITRNWKPEWSWSALPDGGGYALAGCLFKFDPKAPAVQFAWDSDPYIQGAKGTLSLFNPTDAAINLDARLFVNRNNMPELKEQKAITLAPGTNEEIALAIPKDDPTTSYQLDATVKTADGVSIYDRRTKWTKGEPVIYVGKGAEIKKPPLNFGFAYYPSKNKMKLFADITNMPKTAKVTAVTAVVREASNKKVIHTTKFPAAGFKGGRQEVAFNLPPLKGNYEIVVKAAGKGVSAKEVVKTFERTVYPWENSKVGISDKVYAPFTPIEVDGNKLRTVLREYTLNGLGLFDQMLGTSAQTGVAKPILSEPMRYTIKIDGKTLPVTAEQIIVLGAKPNIAKTKASFTAGAFKATSLGTWDYDGTLRVDLTLLPTGGKKIDELTLEIPFDKAAAELIHANSDSIRSPVAQKIPEGQGIVWDGSQVQCIDYIPNFCPYVFIGNAVRGLAWFADNNRGWGWDSKTSNMEVVRNGEQVTLRIHLVNQPTVITHPRTITFGLLGAPVKPRITADGNPNWWRYRYERDNYQLLGTDINWLALGNCGSVYPAGKDMRFWEMIAKGNKEQVSDKEINDLIDYGKHYFEPYGNEPLYWFKACAGYNLRSHLGANMVFYYNRASYNAADEFETFKDEWGLSDFRAFGKDNNRYEIKIVPSKSYIDHALYWYAKSFEVGNNKGVYWDNMFIVATANTEMTAAYKDTSGKIVPATGIWELRDLVKRTFVMMNERGMLPITFPHMTSFNCLPIMSFATVQYDWEWKYSSGEVQDRFTREYIQLATDGELSGVWPVPLGEHGAQADDQWIARTFVASRLVHELDGGSVPKPILDLLDDPALTVYRYWDDRAQPVTTGNKDIPTIVYSVPGREAIVVVVGYSDNDEQVKLNIDPKALGYGDYTVTDTEKKDVTPLSVKGNSVTFPLKKHDMMILRITGGA